MERIQVLSTLDVDQNADESDYLTRAMNDEHEFGHVCLHP